MGRQIPLLPPQPENASLRVISKRLCIRADKTGITHGYIASADSPRMPT
jgi:hypothetical protein